MDVYYEPEDDAPAEDDDLDVGITRPEAGSARCADPEDLEAWEACGL